MNIIVKHKFIYFWMSAICWWAWLERDDDSHVLFDKLDVFLEFDVE